VDQRNSFNIEYKLPAFGSGWFTVLNPQFYWELIYIYILIRETPHDRDCNLRSLLLNNNLFLNCRSLTFPLRKLISFSSLRTLMTSFTLRQRS
jgi:hypothetical protein